MHEQIRTSPSDTERNLRRVADVLANAGVNVEGIGPDFESPHIRTVVTDEERNAALKALEAAGLGPEVRSAVTVSLDNRSGQLRDALDGLVRRGFGIESVLVLASHEDNKVRVSIGVRNRIPSDWEQESQSLAEELVAGAQT